ncbi:MAG: type I DNA topoisomerase [Ilumatobacteraceae bacterium]|nr:type I DNA topoisomerase [Ilumatobacteraceae bacterium]
MSRPLVIVESPAKAKTIAKLLGDEYVVLASVGHIADLPKSGLQVDVEKDFAPNYELTERGTKVLRELKAALKGATELYLATDEDREGEAISYHLVQYLKPKVPVKRMVFHEITRSAIDEAVRNTRDIDQQLVDAAEARRVLDRLFGYTLSPILWRKVNRGLSAGRVQSPAIRLVVEREQERMDFVIADYWDLAAVTATSPSFKAVLSALNGMRVASGRDFDSKGVAKDGVSVISKDRADELTTALRGSDLDVRSIDEKPYRKSPKAPFITSSLQQEAGNKLRLSAGEVMRIAQGLYESGFITYMRTDNVGLSDDAIAAVRSEITTIYGAAFVPAEPRTYKSKVKNAQEAHEAIRPTLPLRAPDSLRSELNSTELNVYRLIWQRTLGSQMGDANGTTLTLRLAAQADTTEIADCEFSASGTTITFPGYRAVYEELDEDKSDDDAEAILPVLKVGDKVSVAELTAVGHTTSPPARFTEPTLVKKLEELGIGRPSTYASILKVIVDRGYVWKKGQALVPSWTAFAVVRLLTQHFSSIIDDKFTAVVEEKLDEIARGERDRSIWLREFYFGNGKDLPGIFPVTEAAKDSIDAREINAFIVGRHPVSGDMIEARPGKYGPYVRSGERTASVPEDLTPEDLTVSKAVELLDAPSNDEPIGQLNDVPVYVKSGRYGPYIQLGDRSDDKEAPLPKTASLFPEMKPTEVTMEVATKLLSLPRVIGADPSDGIEITAQSGRYGPYITKIKDSRTLASHDEIFTITVDKALVLLAEPRKFGRRGPAKPPLREFGNDPNSARPVVAKDGKFGTYITDGETNASLTRGDRLEHMSPERAFELLAARRANPPQPKTRRVAKPKVAKPKVAKKPSAKKKPKKTD